MKTFVWLVSVTPATALVSMPAFVLVRLLSQRRRNRETPGKRSQRQGTVTGRDANPGLNRWRMDGPETGSMALTGQAGVRYTGG
jgi:hypothetical protein